jgi:hypothetical protein
VRVTSERGTRSPYPTVQSVTKLGGGGDTDDRAERDQWSLGTEHGSEGKRPHCRDRDAGGGSERRRLRAEARQWTMTAVAGEQPASRDDEAGARDGEADDEVPRRRGAAKRVGQVLPQHVLELVDEGQKPRGEQRGREADRRAEQDQAQIRPARQLRRRRGSAHAAAAETVRISEAPVG